MTYHAPATIHAPVAHHDPATTHAAVALQPITASDIATALSHMKGCAGLDGWHPKGPRRLGPLLPDLADLFNLQEEIGSSHIWLSRATSV